MVEKCSTSLYSTNTEETGRFISDEENMIVVIVETEIEKPALKLINPVEHSFPKFRCDQCTFTNMPQKGLSQHVRMKHK